MKTFKLILVGIASLLIFAACDHNVSMETTVQADGSLDKSITIEGDSSNISKNFMGINAASGWHVLVEEKDSLQKKDDKKLILTFSKHFNSVEEANNELALPNDTLFRVSSKFDKKFRWFFTYISYSDTYHAINRLTLPTEDYFTTEDYAFIDRLPAEGSPISKADSLYLALLNDKIYESYGSRALFEVYYTKLKTILVEQNESIWIDTLSKYRGTLYHALTEENDGYVNLLEIEGMPKLPISEELLNKLDAEIETQIDFFSLAINGKYQHVINMPGAIVNTNADSVAGNSLYWRPATTKFTLKDYTFYGESRKLNLWAVLVSIGVILVAIILNIYRRKK